MAVKLVTRTQIKKQEASSVPSSGGTKNKCQTPSLLQSLGNTTKWAGEASKAQARAESPSLRNCDCACHNHLWGTPTGYPPKTSLWNTLHLYLAKQTVGPITSGEAYSLGREKHISPFFLFFSLHLIAELLQPTRETQSSPSIPNTDCTSCHPAVWCSSGRRRPE